MSAFAHPITATWRAVAIRETPVRSKRTARVARTPKQLGRKPHVHRVQFLPKPSTVLDPFSFQSDPSKKPISTVPVTKKKVPNKTSRTKQKQQDGKLGFQLTSTEPMLFALTPKPDAFTEIVQNTSNPVLSTTELEEEVQVTVTETKVQDVDQEPVKEVKDIALLNNDIPQDSHQSTRKPEAKKSPKRRRKPQKRGRTSSPTRTKTTGALRDTFQAYMNEISRDELLEQAEIFSLGKRIKAGLVVEKATKSLSASLGRRPAVSEIAKELSLSPAEVQKRLLSGTAAKNALVEANLRLVTSVARKVASSKSRSTAGLAMDDMVQEGNVGLLRAAEKFDPSRGYRFSTYATWWIRAFVMRSLTTQSRCIKVPSTIVDEYNKIRKEFNRIREQGNFKPKDEQVASALGITAAKLRFVVNVVTRTPTSLDITLDSKNSPNSRSLGEIVQGDDNIEEQMVRNFEREELDVALKSCLKPLERAVVRLRFGLDDGQARTLKETGVLLGLSKERIRQVIFRALPKMKTPEIQSMLTDATCR